MKYGRAAAVVAAAVLFLSAVGLAAGAAPTGSGTPLAGPALARPVAPTTAAAPAPPAIRRDVQGQPLVTNVFADSDLRQALSDIAAQTGVTIIPDATVQGTVTADLREVPLESALRMLLVSSGLAFKKLDGYYLVGAPDPSNPNFRLLSDFEVVKLKYVDSRALAAYLSGPYGKYIAVEGAPPQAPTYNHGAMSRTVSTISGVSSTYANLSESSSVASQPLGGTRLFITAPRDIINEIKADLNVIDRPPTQVMLQATVLEITDEGLRELGLDWASRWTRFASQATSTLTGNGTTDITTQAVTNFPQSSLTYSELSFAEMAQLTALVQQGKARLRADPEVATEEGHTAEIEVGQEKYFAIVTGPVTYPYTTLEDIAAGITLRITPTVVDSTREILVRVEPDIRDVSGTGANGLPEITYRRAYTNVRVKDGQSIIIGGLTSEQTNRVVSKLPILGDIPFFGQLFRHTSVHTVKSEVVIIITPHLLNEEGKYPGQPAPPAF